MSAGILRALMQLFAIIARESGSDKTQKSGRDIVAIFLRQQLNKELVNRYLDMYDSFIEELNTRKSGKKERSQKRLAVSSVKVLRICTRINEELAQKEKYFVLIRLMEFIVAFEDTTEQEWEFIHTVADTFNIDKEVYGGIRELISLEEGETKDLENFLYIVPKVEVEMEHARSIQSSALNGMLIFFRLEKENMFFLRYFGTDDLLLNGQVLSAGNSHVFNQGASVRGSKISPIYYSDVIHRFMDTSDSSKIVFRVENVSYYFKRGNKQALHQLNIIEENGSLIGIMGGSGSGKSTLLNVMNGNYTPTYGQVTINGIDIHHSGDQLEGVIGYVAQDDLLIEELSVFQNLFYNAKLCFADKTDDEISALVDQTLQQLGLYEARELKVGSPLDKTISGGQRKRLNIALELIREPSVLFVDEPTSGLSSRDSENIMDLLKELTLRGKLIFVVIHQPSSDIFKMFDKLFLLDQGGYPIYYGNPVESIIYFKRLVNHVNLNESECPVCGNVNPEQLFNIIESKVVDEYGNLTEHRKITPREWNNFFNVIIGNHLRTKKESFEAPDTAFRIPGLIRQLGVFLKRDVLSKLSNKQYMLINMLEAPMLALLLSFFLKFYQSDRSEEASYLFRESENIPQFLFISVIVALFLGLTVSAEEIIRDQKILKREKFLNLSRGSYLMAKIGVMFVISAIQTLMFILVGNTVLEIKGMYLAFWAILFSTSCFANILGLNISASFNSAKVIYIIIPILIIPQLLFSGVIVKFDKLYPAFASQSGVPWIGNIMASRWAYEAMTVYQYKNNAYDDQFYAFDTKIKTYGWKRDFWVKEMRSIVSDVRKQLQGEKDATNLDVNLRILYNEFSKEIVDVKGFEFDYFAALESGKPSVADLDSMLVEIDRLNEYYRANCRLNTRSKDKLNNNLTSTTEKRDAMFAMMNDHHNDQLEEFVTNANDVKRLVTYNEEIVQKTDPIYLVPHHKGFFGAHFYAPSKSFFGTQITTFSGNLIVIWGMTFILAVMLWFDGLRFFVESLGHFFGVLGQKIAGLRSK
ncbi:ATP-binding cassette domain-containing protein [Sanyastnella coralliicola]|uniref:ATP-binding cassette domain-containing protein n=1 Tax=Sanyastnella coralliicola TaxID=3069118 RepID=UPI0027B8D99D|nr:ATP-binding cassette domain-containing protein [Longitalea sp. SCSIO 12813]